MKELLKHCQMWCGGCLCESSSLKFDDEVWFPFKLLQEKDRIAYFSLVGHEPEFAEIAIIGLNPATTQLRNFCSLYLETKDFEKSRKESAFSNSSLRGNLVKILDYLGVASLVGLRSSLQFFTPEGREKVLMTSVVKCASLNVEPSRRAADWKVLNYSFAVKCAVNRLPFDLGIPRKLKAIFVLGDKAVDALKNLSKDNEILYEYIDNRIAPIIELPHPSGANNENILIFIGVKKGEEVKQRQRYLNCIELRNRAIKKIKQISA